MAEPNQNPPAPPAPGQADGTPPEGGTPPAGGTPPEGGGQPPAAANNGTPSGGVNEEPQSNISVKELNDLKRKAGRWDAGLKRSRKARQANRGNRSNPDLNADDADPELLDAVRDRDDKITELNSANTKLAVKDKVRDMLETEEYKGISDGVRRAITKNPLGFASADAQTVDEAVADIQDYLDDELDQIAANPPADAGGTPPEGGNPPAGDTPPAGGSGPSKPDVDVNQGTEGQTGSKRSVGVLQNMLKKK